MMDKLDPEGRNVASRLFSALVKSSFVRAQILALVRHLVTAAGVTLIAKGYADQGIIEGAAGLATTVVGFWLAQSDVKKVDQKIETAFQVGLNTPSPVLTPEQEVNETRLLNIQLRHGIGK